MPSQLQLVVCDILCRNAAPLRGAQDLAERNSVLLRCTVAMWYYYVRSITIATSAEEIRSIFDDLLQVLQENPFVCLAKGLVTQFAQDFRAQAPGMWNPTVARSFGALLQKMTQLFPADTTPEVAKEWSSVLEQVCVVCLCRSDSSASSITNPIGHIPC